MRRGRAEGDNREGGRKVEAEAETAAPRRWEGFAHFLFLKKSCSEKRLRARRT